MQWAFVYQAREVRINRHVGHELAGFKVRLGLLARRRAVLDRFAQNVSSAEALLRSAFSLRQIAEDWYRTDAAKHFLYC